MIYTVFLLYFSTKAYKIIHQASRSHLLNDILRYTYRLDDGDGYDRGGVPGAHTY
jgi:hypothetical protein